VSAFLREGAWFGARRRDPGPHPGSIRTAVSTGRGDDLPRGDPPFGLSALLDGRVWLVQHVGPDTENLIHVAEPGFWTGEYAILTGQPVVVTIVAHTPCARSSAAALRSTNFNGVILAFTGQPRSLRLSRFGVCCARVRGGNRSTAEGRLRLVLADRAEMPSGTDPEEDPGVLDAPPGRAGAPGGPVTSDLNGSCRSSSRPA